MGPQLCTAKIIHSPFRDTENQREDRQEAALGPKLLRGQCPLRSLSSLKLRGLQWEW